MDQKTSISFHFCWYRFPKTIFMIIPKEIKFDIKWWFLIQIFFCYVVLFSTISGFCLIACLRKCYFCPFRLDEQIVFHNFLLKHSNDEKLIKICYKLTRNEVVCRVRGKRRKTWSESGYFIGIPQNMYIYRLPRNSYMKFMTFSRAFIIFFHYIAVSRTRESQKNVLWKVKREIKGSKSADRLNDRINSQMPHESWRATERQQDHVTEKDNNNHTNDDDDGSANFAVV